MKICILSDFVPPKGGGASIMAWNIARGLVQKGDDVMVITTVRQFSEAGLSIREGIRVTSIHADYHTRWQAYVSLWNPSVVKQVRSALDEFSPDVVHAHNVHAYLSYGALAAAKRSGARVILTFHDAMAFHYGKLTGYVRQYGLVVPQRFDYRVSAWEQVKEQKLRYNPCRNIIIRLFFRFFVDGLITVSHALRDALEQNGIRKVEVIHNGIDVRDWELDNASVLRFKAERGIGDSAILYAGRLSTIKGGLKLIEALPQIAASVPGTQLLVVGPKDENMEQMLAVARKLGVEERIIFTGFLSGADLRDAFWSAAALATPSIYCDPFPTVNLEAMACAKPVVATCFGGSREVVEDGSTGFVVNPFDVSSLAEKLSFLLLNREKAEKMGRAGYARIAKEFTSEAMLEAYHGRY